MDKNRLFSEFQKLGKVLMAPVLILPIAGILVGIGSGFTNPKILELFPFLKNLTIFFKKSFIYEYFKRCRKCGK